MTALIVGSFVALGLVIVAYTVVVNLRDDEETSPARSPRPVHGTTGLGRLFPLTSLIALSRRPDFGRATHVPSGPIAENARAAWDALGARKTAEYEARLDAVETGEQDTAVIEAISA